MKSMNESTITPNIENVMEKDKMLSHTIDESDVDYLVNLQLTQELKRRKIITSPLSSTSSCSTKDDKNEQYLKKILEEVKLLQHKYMIEMKELFELRSAELSNEINLLKDQLDELIKNNRIIPNQNANINVTALCNSVLLK